MTDRMTDSNVNERIDLFLKLNTYSFIKNIYSKYFNGHIIRKEKTHIIFKDDILGEIPLLIKEIIEIDYSQKTKPIDNLK